jgi:hypothetical protein
MVDHHNREDRFGVPVQRIIDVMKAHSSLIRDGCNVPTRAEVATWPPERLWWHLLGWWWESPSELIPTDEQGAARVEVLRSRPDAAARNSGHHRASAAAREERRISAARKWRLKDNKKPNRLSQGDESQAATHRRSAVAGHKKEDSL